MTLAAAKQETKMSLNVGFFSVQVHMKMGLLDFNYTIILWSFTQRNEACQRTSIESMVLFDEIPGVHEKFKVCRVQYD